MGVPMLDLKAQWAKVADEVMAEMQPVFDNCYYVLGPPVKELERELAEYSEAPYAVGCASGSDALILALMALDVGPGDEVIMPTFTFFASAGAVARIGAIPVFADVDAATFNLTASEIERLATPKTKAVMPVHLFGQVCEMKPIAEVCRAKGLGIVEDAAQSIGAKYQGRRVGNTLGDIATFSFYPTKNLGCMGDGGMIVTQNEGLAERMRLLRNHGDKGGYDHHWVGMNSRLDSLHAATLRVKLRYLESWHEGRRKNAAALDEALKDTPGIVIPRIHPDCWSIYNQYTVRILNGRRDEVMQVLRDAGIGCAVYYPTPLHLQECFAELGGKPGSMPVAEQACHEVLSLPVFPEMSDAQRDELINKLKQILS